MHTSIECLPCMLRQAVDVARVTEPDPLAREELVREILKWLGGADFRLPPPAITQQLHRRMRELTGVADPYREARARQNRFALSLVPRLRSTIERAADPLVMALRVAVAGNMIDLGASSEVSEEAVLEALQKIEATDLAGDVEALRSALSHASAILYLADNAGEIVFDRLLIEQFPTGRVTVAVRGAPILNDATVEDALAAGIDEVAEIIDNGSDAPGTLLEECSAEFRQRFETADLVIAKGQGNFECLASAGREIFFLFQVKCALVFSQVGLPVGTPVLLRGGCVGGSPNYATAAGVGSWQEHVAKF